MRDDSHTGAVADPEQSSAIRLLENWIKSLGTIGSLGTVDSSEEGVVLTHCS